MTAIGRKMSIDEGSSYVSSQETSSAGSANSSEIHEEKSSNNNQKMFLNVLLVEDVIANQKTLTANLLKSAVPTTVKLRVYVVDNVEDAIAAAAKKSFLGKIARKAGDKVISSEQQLFSKISFQVVFADKQIFKDRKRIEHASNGGCFVTQSLRELQFKKPIYSISSSNLEEGEMTRHGYTADLTKSAYGVMRQKVEEAVKA